MWRVIVKAPVEDAGSASVKARRIAGMWDSRDTDGEDVTFAWYADDFDAADRLSEQLQGRLREAVVWVARVGSDELHAGRRPRYDERRGWIGGDSRTLYAFVDRLTGYVRVAPGGDFRGIGPNTDVRLATRDEALAAGWPADKGWTVAGHSAGRRRSAEAVEYLVHTGRPSWHQSRAGHISSAVGVYRTREEAERYVANYKRHHPDEPAFIVESPPRRAGGARRPDYTAAQRGRDRERSPGYVDARLDLVREGYLPAEAERYLDDYLSQGGSLATMHGRSLRARR